MSWVSHSLVGYDGRSECVAEEFHVPDTVLPKAKELAHVPDDGPAAFMCYPLDASSAQDLAYMLRAEVDTERHHYFLEGFADPGAPYEFADDAKFRLDSLKWSVWIHSDAKKNHIKVSVSRTTLDDYSSRRGHKDIFAVIDLLNARIKNKVQETINCAIDNGRVTAGHLELNGRDLTAMFDE